MSIFDEKPHHRVNHKYGGVSFWKENSASNEDHADKAVLYCGPPGMPYPEFVFKWPEEKHGLERLESALVKAFEAGVRYDKRQLREFIGVKESR